MSTVLVVDDESGIRDLLTRWLSAAGLDVRSAETAEAALEAMEIGAADVVMCDVEMPGQGGLWLAEQIRDRFTHTAMVLATGMESVPPAISLKSGIVEYLVKPLERVKVLAAVAKGVRWHGAALAAGLVPEKAGQDLEEWLKKPGSKRPA
jgi:DNA-binding NtrC family response regulator